MTNAKWLTLSEIQSALDAGEREALDAALQRRELPLVKFGREYLVEEADWQAWRERAA